MLFPHAKAEFETSSETKVRSGFYHGLLDLSSLSRSCRIVGTFQLPGLIVFRRYRMDVLRREKWRTTTGPKEAPAGREAGALVPSKKHCRRRGQNVMECPEKEVGSQR